MFCVRADDRDAATAWTPAVTRHGPVTVAVTGGGDPRRAMAVRDLVAARAARPAATRRAGAAPGVALVGAGPGDPELITVKGRRLLAAADVVVADRLVPGLLLDELRPDVELVDAAKIPYGPSRGPGGDQPDPGRPGAGRASSWSGSRAATRTSSAAAARRCSRAPRPACRCGRARRDQLDRRARRWPASRSPTAAWRTSSPWSPATCRRTTRRPWWTGRRWPGMRGTLVVLMGLKNLPAIAGRLIARRPAGGHPGRGGAGGHDRRPAGAAQHARRGRRRRGRGRASGRRRSWWSATWSDVWHRRVTGG